MKKIFLSITLMAAVAIGWCQNSSTITANYEAAKWKTKMIADVQSMRLAPPPNESQSQAELKIIRQKMMRLDDKAKAAVNFWNSGAPSYRWNQLAPKVITWDNPDLILRTPIAWMNLAVYDATILAWREKLKYKRIRPQKLDPSLKPTIASPLTYSYPCEHTVTAAAAAYVLAYFLPAKGDSIIQLARQASQSRVDAGVQYPSDVEAGWKLGEMVAKEVIEKARQDGSTQKFTGAVNKDPKKWTGAYAMGINLPLYKTLALRSADQFRPPPPPDFASEMQDIKNYKQNFRSRALAYYWANTGPGFWTEIASQKMFESRMSDDAPAVARVYTVMNTAFHDMAIAVFDAKYAYWGIRPSQYDSTFKPLIQTPPFPGYPSGHAAGAGTTCAVLSYYFPADAKQFEELAQDCADSRFFAGIHFKTDNEVALKMGKELGRYVAETWMK